MKCNNRFDLAYAMIATKKEFFAEFPVPYLSWDYNELNNALYDNIELAYPTCIQRTKGPKESRINKNN